MAWNILREEAGYIRKSQKIPKIGFVFTFLFVALLLSILGCEKRERMKEQAMIEIWQQGKDILSLTYEKGKNLKYIAEYGLDDDWIFSGNRIETLYTKGFFFLFEIESTFTNKTNNELKIIISSIHSCSGVPPHFVLIERNHFQFNDKTGTGKMTKTEVLEGGMLTLAPTEQDSFGDVLYSAVKDDEQFEEFLVNKGFLSLQKQVEFRKIQKETGKASLGQALIEEGIFSSEEWERIERQYWAEKGKKMKGRLSPEVWNNLFGK
ncbi:hypothetical protein KA005_74770 [bacterium]|nr:hypothetical protein [bacterium]